MSRLKTYQAGAALIFLLMVLPLPGLRAQSFNAGFFGGLTASQVDGDQYGGFNKLGMTAGFFVNREIDKNFYWQLEIKYVTRGALESEPEIYFYDKTVYRYIEIPLSVNYLLDEKYQFELGLSPEVLLSYAHYDGNGQTEPSLYPDNNRFGLSVFAGIVYWFVPSTGVGFRYTYSAISFRPEEEWNNPQYRGHFHNVLAFTVNYKFKPR